MKVVVTRWWLENVADMHVHGTTKRRPLEAHAEELPHLLPLPAHDDDTSRVVYRLLEEDGFIRYPQNEYSAPWRYVGRTLPVRITEQELLIYNLQIEPIARHLLFPASQTGGQRTDPAHRPPRDVQQQLEVLRQRFAQWGESGRRFLEGLLAKHRQGRALAHKILVLARCYQQADVVAARQRAIRYQAFSCAQQMDELIARGEQQQQSPLEFLERFLAEPARQRTERSIERRLREAGFHHEGATLEAFDWQFNARWIDRAQIEELATGDFLRRKDSLVFAGQSGLGKSHLIQGIGRRLCMAGYRVRYTTSAALFEDLHRAAGEHTLPRRLRYYTRFDLLIIDEFGFDRLERLEYPQAPSLLYKVLDSRSGQKSTALVTNIEFDAWGEYLGDPPLAMALLDRVVDGAIIHKFQGQSYRAHRAKKANAQGASQDPPSAA